VTGTDRDQEAGSGREEERRGSRGEPAGGLASPDGTTAGR